MREYSDRGRIVGSFRAILGKIMTVSSLIMTLNGYIQIQRTFIQLLSNAVNSVPTMGKKIGDKGYH